jgi:hypothetical protein
MPFNPTDELNLNFTVAEWNQIIAQLQEGVYRIVAPLINKINVQAAQHEQRQKDLAAPGPPPFPVTPPAFPVAPPPAGYTNGEMRQPGPTTIAVAGDQTGTITLTPDPSDTAPDK